MELKRFGAGQSPAWSTIKKTGDRLSMVGSGVAMGCLLIAVATDHWLYTHDEINHNWIDKATNVTWFAPAEVKVHSGLWRACTYFYDVNVLRAGL